MRLRFTSPDGGFGGQLSSNPVAHDLAVPLPWEISFSDGTVVRIDRHDPED
jgi:hypothetical protein